MTEELTVVCVWVQGNVPYSPEYVIRLQSMCRRLLPPHRFICLTDKPDALPWTLEKIEVRCINPSRAWWTKVRLFDTTLPLSGRVVYIDLDVLLLRDLTDIVKFNAIEGGISLIPHAGQFEGRDALKVVKRFNSSVMVWNAGDFGELWTDWSPLVMKRLWGDQDWLGERLGKRVSSTMPARWFPRISEVRRPPWPRDARMILCKKPKNHEMASQHAWFSKEWQ